MRNRFRERDGGVEVEAFEHAVAGDVGVDDRGDAGILEALRNVERGEFATSSPSLRPRPCRRGRRARPRSGPEKLSRGFLDQRRIAHRGGADNDAGDAFAEPALDVGAVANAAAKLHRDFHRREDALDRGGVHRPPGEGAIEIDDVQILEALRREARAPARPDRD